MASPETKARRFTGNTLVLATHNKGKAREIQELMAPFGVTVLTADALGLPEPDETEDSFIGNAVLKARAAATTSGHPALADDSGLAVDALNGAPGIYSARWAGESKDFGFAMKRVNDELGAIKDRTGRFICALALAWPDGHVQAFQGEIEGELVWPPRGDKGFGYDPMFVPHGYDKTFGELDPAVKHAMSHRALAFAQLVVACFKK